ncbi:hypothetical protein BGZ83_011062 [Gryganskiella cystojenkinii]|nr:hypothetical protein BGZ83_011062 [Gryganskiella cystojenkinii]
MIHFVHRIRQLSSSVFSIDTVVPIAKMQSAGLRRLEQAGGNAAPPVITSDDLQDPLYIPVPGRKKGRVVPKFTIDLSLAPEDRYTLVAVDLRETVENSSLPLLFDTILNGVGFGLGRLLRAVAPVILQRLYTDEETAEIRGISRAIGLPMHLLVAFNVLLDLLLGCTSGGLRVDEPGQESRILHMRTLDWGMDQLRELTVELDFVRYPGGPVVATTVTYLGYVGVLTGVRKGLSISLNFRPHHDRSTWATRIAFRWHQAMVVLGFRQSISSVLRHILLDPELPQSNQDDDWDESDALSEDSSRSNEEETDQVDMCAILSALSSSQSTAAYLIFCTPEQVTIVEKDHRKASVRQSNEFLVAYNHDVADESIPPQIQKQDLKDVIGSMTDLVAWSLDRKGRVDKEWKKRVRAGGRLTDQHNAVTLQDIMQVVNDKEISLNIGLAGQPQLVSEDRKTITPFCATLSCTTSIIIIYYQRQYLPEQQ